MQRLAARIMFSVTALLVLATARAAADDWPQWLGSKRDGVWRETGIIEKFPADGPKILWRTPIDQGYAGPAVANGKVFVTDRVLAKNAKNPDDPFGKTTRVSGVERVLCLDQAKGTVLWKQEYPSTYEISYA